MEDLGEIRCQAPEGLKFRGRWIDNGVLSNMHRGEAEIIYRSVRTRSVEQAYVAAKNPDAMVTVRAKGIDFSGPFHELISQITPFQAKLYGKPISHGGIVDARHDWEDVCLAAMWSF